MLVAAPAAASQPAGQDDSQGPAPEQGNPTGVSHGEPPVSRPGLRCLPAGSIDHDPASTRTRTRAQHSETRKWTAEKNTADRSIDSIKTRSGFEEVTRPRRSLSAARRANFTENPEIGQWQFLQGHRATGGVSARRSLAADLVAARVGASSRWTNPRWCAAWPVRRVLDPPSSHPRANFTVPAPAPASSRSTPSRLINSSRPSAMRTRPAREGSSERDQGLGQLDQGRHAGGQATSRPLRPSSLPSSMSCSRNDLGLGTTRTS